MNLRVVDQHLFGSDTLDMTDIQNPLPPQLSQVSRTVWVNTREFLTKAGTIIFCLSVLLWAMTYYPRLPEAQKTTVAQPFDEQLSVIDPKGTAVIEAALVKHERISETRRYPDGTIEHIDREDPAEVAKRRAETVKGIEQARENAIASAQLRHSIAGRFGHAIEPVIRPLGYDWKMGVGLVSAFAAREVFVIAMAITYSAGDEDNTADLSAAMRGDRYPDGRPVWTPLVAVSLLIWFVLAMQCMSTLAVVKRETGGWKWPIAMLVYMNALAYVVCLVVYQVGRMWLA